MANLKFFHRDYMIMSGVDEVVRILTLSDLVILSSFGLITPVFAVFITDHIIGGSVEVVGVAFSIYLISKSMFQIPLASFIDKVKGERDDFWALFIGYLCFSLVPLLYFLVETPFELYLVQFFYGFVSALTVPSWLAIFSRHINQGKEGIEWGLYSTLTGLGSAFTASLGGFIAFRYGFNVLFVTVSLFSFFGTFFLLQIYQKMKVGKILEDKKKIK